MAILNDLMVKSAARIIGDTYANKFIKDGGTSTLCLMADGSVKILNLNPGETDIDFSKFLPLTAGPTRPLIGDLYLSAPSACPSIIFQRTGSGNYDWRLNNSSGTFYLQNGTDSATWTDRLYIDTSGNITVSGTSTSTGFKKTSSSNDYVLLGGGGHMSFEDLDFLEYAVNTGIAYNSSSGTLNKRWGLVADYTVNIKTNGNYTNVDTTATFLITNYFKYDASALNKYKGANGIIQVLIRYESGVLDRNRTFVKWIHNSSIPNNEVVMTLKVTDDTTLTAKIYIRIGNTVDGGSNYGSYAITKLLEFYWGIRAHQWKLRRINVYADGITDSDFGYSKSGYNNITYAGVHQVTVVNGDDRYFYGSEEKILPIYTNINAQNIYANAFIKNYTDDVLLANGETITQAQLLGGLGTVSGASKSIWGATYVNSSGALQSVTGNLTMPSGKYIKASISDTSGTAILYYENGNIFGAFGNGTTTIPTYIRSTDDNLYHRKGNSGDSLDYKILDANNYTDYAVSLTTNQSISGTKTFTSDVKLTTLDFIGTTNYINLASDSNLYVTVNGATSSNSIFMIEKPTGPGSYYIFRPYVNGEGYLGRDDYKWGGVSTSSLYSTTAYIGSKGSSSTTGSGLLRIYNTSKSATYTTLKSSTSTSSITLTLPSETGTLALTKDFVTSLGTNDNYLTWTKNNVTNNITIPFATNADKVKWTSNSDNKNYPLAFCTTNNPTSDDYYQNYFDSNFNYNPDTKTLTATNFNGCISTTEDISNALYPIGVRSNATTSLKYNSNITMSNGVITLFGIENSSEKGLYWRESSNSTTSLKTLINVAMASSGNTPESINIGTNFPNFIPLNIHGNAMFLNPVAYNIKYITEPSSSSSAYWQLLFGEASVGNSADAGAYSEYILSNTSLPYTNFVIGNASNSARLPLAGTHIRIYVLGRSGVQSGFNLYSICTGSTYTTRITVITDMRTGDTNSRTPVQFNNKYYTYIPFMSDTVSTAMIVDLIWTSPTVCKAFVLKLPPE